MNFKKNIKNSKTIGIAHIQITLNSTFITITDLDGNTKVWTSSRQSGFKTGKQRCSTYAAHIVGENAAKAAVQLGLKLIHAKLKGVSRRKSFALRGLALGGLIIRTISDRTSIPHNGCRPPKKRRI